MVALHPGYASADVVALVSLASGTGCVWGWEDAGVGATLPWQQVRKLGELCWARLVLEARV